MEFRLTPEQESLRREVCEWLRQELGADHDTDPVPVPPGYMPHREFERKLGARGWLALNWPTEYGGSGRSNFEQFLVEEEIGLHGGPAADALGRCIVGPFILAFGTEEQKREHLHRMARGEETWCLGYTEPEVGSDLAGAQTRAIPEGDYYLVSGRKIFSSGAHQSDFCLLVARTDPAVPKHQGISVLIVPMDAPGVTVRPLYNMLDLHEFNEVIFDNVRVPRDSRVGPENGGWQLMNSALGAERITVYRSFLYWRAFRALVRYVREHDLGPRQEMARQGLAEIAIGFELARLLLYRAVLMRDRGLDYRPEAAMVKLFNSELAQRLYNLGVAILGLHGALREGSPRALWSGAIAHGYLSVVQQTIGAGTSEVQRNIIALRGLGLPRG